MRKNTFACNVLTDKKIKKYLNRKDYEAFKKLKAFNGEVSPYLANKIANAIKKWAVTMGATHFSHWFFPLSNSAAEKQVSFIEYDKHSNIILKFRGDSLLKCEVDASSFPNGGIVNHFDAKGYLKWDYNSSIYIRTDRGIKVVYIPCVFCSQNGDSLDEKMPLNKALNLLNKEATKLLNSLGYNTKNVVCNVGCEQEFFIIDKLVYNRRKDLLYTSRTLLDDRLFGYDQHYLGMIPSRGLEYFSDLNCELWKLGIASKIQHKECASSQYEIVTLFSDCRYEPEKNYLLMDVMQSVAERHELKIIFHEKPFNNLSGSGKHNNWSISANNGINLLDPTKCDSELFMLIFTTIIAGIDNHYKLLQLATYSYSNHMRLGGSEAPPSIFSIHISDNLMFKLHEYTKGEQVNISNLDYDRNRTSPFVFTGNKFELRLVGAGQNIFFVNTILATVVAEEIKRVNEIIRNNNKSLKQTIKQIIQNNLKDHEKIIFNGNNYTKEWENESNRRGIINPKNAINIYSELLTQHNKQLFRKSGVLNEKELNIRFSELVKKYINDCTKEAYVLCDIIRSQVLPSIEKQVDTWTKYSSDIDINSSVDNKKMILTKNYEILDKLVGEIQRELISLNNKKSCNEKIRMCDNSILLKLDKVRNIYRDISGSFSEENKPFPTYNEILQF